MSYSDVAGLTADRLRRSQQQIQSGADTLNSLALGQVLAEISLHATKQPFLRKLNVFVPAYLGGMDLDHPDAIRFCVHKLKKRGFRVHVGEPLGWLQVSWKASYREQQKALTD